MKKNPTRILNSKNESFKEKIYKAIQRGITATSYPQSILLLLFGVWKNRQHVMINIKGGDQIGWGETKVANNQPDCDLPPWSEEFKKLKGMKLLETLEKPQ